jgi:Na+/H+-dicarboxylate symporter
LKGEEKMSKRKFKLHHKIFMGLFLGVVFGYILNGMGGVDNPLVNDRILPFLQFLGDFFLKSIRMLVVPLVLFSIMDGVLSLGDVKKLRNIGLKTILFFLGSAMIAVTIGLILGNIIKPGAGFQMGEVATEIQVKELPGAYQTILDLIPSNPFLSMVEGNMMQVIVFAILFGIAVIMVGNKAKPLVGLISNLSETMFKIINIVLVIIPYGVFGLMSVAITKFGLAIFGPVAKFIFVLHLPDLHRQGQPN